ncbi:MAG: hypothetical protein ACKVOU_15155 [Cytophagales bacterium]
MKMNPTISLSLRGISYVYDELSSEERQDFKSQKIINSWLYEEVEENKSLKYQIENSQLNPSISSLKNILAYSKNVY